MDGEKVSGACRIALCSGDRLRRDVLAAYLGVLPDFRVVARVDRPGALAALPAAQQPDIVVIDGGRRPGLAVPVVRSLAEILPGARTVLLHEHLPAEESAAVHDSGASSVVASADGLVGMLSALRTLAADARTNGDVGGLTVRQRDILKLMAAGRNVSEIAELLAISPGTVENHKRRVYAKLNCASATEAVARAASLGLIDNSLPAAPVTPAVALANPRDGAVLVVVVGDSGEVVDRVVLSLIRHRLPVVRDHRPAPSAEVHWGPWHRGPVVRVLVRPTEEQWWVGATLGWAAVLVHDGDLDTPVMDLALARGVQAALSVDQLEERLAPVVQLVAAGYLVMDPAAARPFNESMWARSAELPMAPPALTPREHDILREIGRNHTVRQTARALGIAGKTVENAQGNLFRKLGVHNRAAALAKAYALGLLHPG
jgi:DNA-binding NarL/FixJ family response regulator